MSTDRADVDGLDAAFEWWAEESLRLAELGLPAFVEVINAEEQERTEGDEHVSPPQRCPLPSCSWTGPEECERCRGSGVLDPFAIFGAYHCSDCNGVGKLNAYSHFRRDHSRVGDVVDELIGYRTSCERIGYRKAVDALRDDERFYVWLRDHGPAGTIGQRELLACYLVDMEAPLIIYSEGTTP